MPGAFSPPPWVSDPDMHHGTCVTLVPKCMPGSLTCGFLWGRGKTFPVFLAHGNPQFYVSGKKSIETAKSYRVYTLFHKQRKTFPKLPLNSKCLFRKPSVWLTKICKHYNDVTVSVIACQITCVSIVYSNKTAKLRVTSLCEGNSLMTGEFPAQRASNAENVSTWWRHHINLVSNFLADILYPNVIGFCQSWKLWKKIA